MFIGQLLGWVIVLIMVGLAIALSVKIPEELRLSPRKSQKGVVIGFYLMGLCALAYYTYIGAFIICQESAWCAL